ncbi:MAG: polyprenol monophosphomannose synthase, partial [Planctomycetes bacterium]|nr:polyprenol monophosphomannose synthase [Planctomycetota bacterium]
GDQPADARSAEPWPPGRVLVVTATFNERESIGTLCRDVLDVDPALQLLVVDDDSPAGTAGIVLEAARCEPRLHVLVRRGRRGLGSAILEGFETGRRHGFEVAVNMDADFSHDPADIPRLLAALEPAGMAPASVALGSRRVPGGRIVGWPVSRHVASVLVNWFARWVIGIPARDSSTGFRAVRLDVFDRIRGPFESGYAFQEDLLWRIHRAGGRIVEVPITFTNRTEGKSKAGFRQSREAIMALLRMAARARWR